AEGTLSPDGKTIVFTSLRDGDLDIYTMRVDGSGLRRLTSALGYDGGPFFSPDGKLIVYRAYHPPTAADSAEYRSLLAQHLVRPLKLDLWVMNADGSAQRQATPPAGARLAPAFHPAGSGIIVASSQRAPASRHASRRRAQKTPCSWGTSCSSTRRSTGARSRFRSRDSASCGCRATPSPGGTASSCSGRSKTRHPT